jgi:hypothetical protein
MVLYMILRSLVLISKVLLTLLETIIESCIELLGSADRFDESAPIADSAQLQFSDMAASSPTKSYERVLHGLSYPFPSLTKRPNHSVSSASRLQHHHSQYCSETWPKHGNSLPPAKKHTSLFFCCANYILQCHLKIQLAKAAPMHPSSVSRYRYIHLVRKQILRTSMSPGTIQQDLQPSPQTGLNEQPASSNVKIYIKSYHDNDRSALPTP